MSYSTDIKMQFKLINADDIVKKIVKLRDLFECHIISPGLALRIAQGETKNIKVVWNDQCQY